MVKKKKYKTRKTKRSKKIYKKEDYLSIFKKVLFILALCFISAIIISFSYRLLANRKLSTNQSNMTPSRSQTSKNTTGSAKENITQDQIELSNFEIGNTLTAEYVYLTKPGYIVVYEYPDGKKGSVIGKSKLLKEGQRKKVLIQLSRSTTMNEVLFAALYTDDGDGIYEVPGDDRAIIDEKGKEVGVSFAIGGSGAESPRI